VQVQSNALAALEAIDAGMAAEVMNEGCVTGDRINGLCDGISGDWYCKFDTYHPAVNNGLPVTRVISRVTLQQILAKYAENIGGEVIQPNTKVVSFSEDSLEGHDRVRLTAATVQHL
jgi:zeaxanthin epoxidase